MKRRKLLKARRSRDQQPLCGLQQRNLMQGRLCALCFHLAMVHLCNVRIHVIKRHSVGPEHKKIIQMEHKQKEEKTKKRDARPKVPVYY